MSQAVITFTGIIEADDIFTCVINSNVIFNSWRVALCQELCPTVEQLRFFYRS